MVSFSISTPLFKNRLRLSLSRFFVGNCFPQHPKAVDHVESSDDISREKELFFHKNRHSDPLLAVDNVDKTVDN